MQGNRYTPAMIGVVSQRLGVEPGRAARRCGGARPHTRARPVAHGRDVRVGLRHRAVRGVQRRPLRSRLLRRTDLRAAGLELRAPGAAAREQRALRAGSPRRTTSACRRLAILHGIDRAIAAEESPDAIAARGDPAAARAARRAARDRQHLRLRVGRSGVARRGRAPPDAYRVRACATRCG